MKKLVALFALLPFIALAQPYELVWDNPTENTDGTPLTAFDIRIYQDGTLLATVPGSGTTQSYELPVLAPGAYTFYCTAVYDGQESGPSQTVKLTIYESIPNAPGGFKVIIVAQ